MDEYTLRPKWQIALFLPLAFLWLPIGLIVGIMSFLYTESIDGLLFPIVIGFFLAFNKKRTP